MIALILWNEWDQAGRGPRHLVTERIGDGNGVDDRAEVGVSGLSTSARVHRPDTGVTRRAKASCSPGGRARRVTWRGASGAFLALLLLSGCLSDHASVQTEKQQGIVNLQTDLDAAIAKIGQLELQIGGGSGDTISMWLLIVGVFLSGWLYPLMWKPMIRALRNGKKSSGAC